MDTAPDVVAFLRGIAGELADIHRGSDYSLWRGEAKHRVDQYLWGPRRWRMTEDVRTGLRSRGMLV
ncbi:hypothetical protein [Mesorhizobium sp. M1A.F.Ca.ET.072.01.1.1]|uniref:hypothetical protein n=1 Tax=Mesorhizobium sp. M1A.F.Ca.ET.072.01.1.1 TaxID=2496753 RepID=UPI001676D695|nr:hypothetical protein [Mesorhizobium sp. M1A.F.Ca.ET.072.01.1.1]